MRKVKYEYNAEEDTLYAWLGNGERSFVEQVDELLGLERALHTEQVVAYRLVGIKELLANVGKSTAAGEVSSAAAA